MALIKRDEIDAMTRSARVMDLGDLERRGELLKQAAREEAARIVAEAKAERERLLSGAREEGHAEGLAEGRKSGHAEGSEAGKAAAIEQVSAQLSTLTEAWTAALSGFESAREDMLLAARQDVLELALVLAERVTKRVVTCDREVASSQLEAVIAALADPTGVELVVAPVDEVVVREALSVLTQRIGALRHATLVVDRALSPGSCVARCPGGGRIDGSIRAQLERVLESVMPGASARLPDDEVSSDAETDGAPVPPAEDVAKPSEPSLDEGDQDDDMREAAA